MGFYVERIRRTNKDALKDMEAETVAGHTCGAPHRSLVRGIHGVMLNQETDAEEREKRQEIIDGKLNDVISRLEKNGFKKGFELKTKLFTLKGDNLRDFGRIVFGLAFIYVFMYVTDVLPEKWRIGNARVEVLRRGFESR